MTSTLTPGLAPTDATRSATRYLIDSGTIPNGLRSVPAITGIILALIGLVISGGGVWLAALGGSLYYFIAGIGILTTGALLVARHRSALWVYAAVLIGTLIWAVGEVGFDWWPLAARGDVIFPIALWLLTPWITRNLDRGAPAGRRYR